MMNKVKTKIYLSKTINRCTQDTIEKVVCSLYDKFPTFRELITDAYINKAEKMNKTHEQQRKKYYYESELNRTGNRRKKSQAELVQKIKLNI